MWETQQSRLILALLLVIGGLSTGIAADAWGARAQASTIKTLQVSIRESFQKGYEQGVKEATPNLSQACVAWWFDSQDTQKRLKQVKEAICNK